MAAVAVQGHTPIQIAHAISAVFQDAGYQPLPLPNNKDLRLVFEKPGGTSATILYGGWSANSVWYRVRLEILTSGPDTYLVTCNAFRVLDHDVSTLESEHKLSRVKQGPYRHLLDEVATRLNKKGSGA